MHAYIELASYMGKENEFSDPSFIKAGASIHPSKFFNLVTTLPILKPIIIQMGCWPSGAAAGERNFKAQSHVHSKARNRLVSDRIKMQSLVYYNSRQLKRNIVNIPRMSSSSNVLEWAEKMCDESEADDDDDNDSHETEGKESE